MATYTTNFDLKKPAGDENMNINDINGNMDTIDNALRKTDEAVAIVSKGNVHGAISSGEYVYVYNHSTLPDGLYKATSAIGVNGTLSTSNLSALSKGMANDLLSSTVKTNSRVVIDRNSKDSLADCNAITTPGMYRLINSTLNKPSNISYGILLHMMSNDYITQLVINTAGSVMAIRGKSAGSWSAWKLVTLTAET